VHINATVKAAIANDQPAISVDTKKKVPRYLGWVETTS
jgi:hypothetical protein